MTVLLVCWYLNSTSRLPAFMLTVPAACQELPLGYLCALYEAEGEGRRIAQ